MRAIPFKVLSHLKFRTQIIISFAGIILFVGTSAFLVLQLTFRADYQKQENEKLTAQCMQLAENVNHSLDFYFEYLNLIAADADLLSCLKADDLGGGKSILNRQAKEFLQINRGRVESISLHLSSEKDWLEEIGISDHPFNSFGVFDKKYMRSVFLTGTYLNRRNEKVFSIVYEISQTKGQTCYLELRVYETELCALIHNGGDNLIIISCNDNLLSMNDRQTFSKLLFKAKRERSANRVIETNAIQFKDTSFLTHGEGTYRTKISIAADYAYLGKRYRSILISFIGFIIAAIAIALMIAWLLTKQLERRLRVLQVKIADVSNKQLSEQIGIDGRDEFSLLADELDITRRHILSLIDQNNRVNEAIRIAEMKALRAQINSHFLFNSLSTIKWLSRKGETQQLEEAVESLALFLRYSLSITDNQILLKDEVSQLMAYTYLQSLRYGKEVQVYIDIDDELMQEKTVRLILQPLVENSIYHGRRSDGSDLHISIYSSRDEHYYYLMVEDDGKGMSEQTIQEIVNGKKELSESGYGLRNVIERLSMCLGEDEQEVIHFQSAENEYTVITIRQPLHQA